VDGFASIIAKVAAIQQRERATKDMDNSGNHWNLGDALHILQIAVLLVSIGIVYAKFDANAITTGVHTEQLNRIEHYLSSKDPNYWKDSRKDE
jgi:hypothetical protein